MTGCQAIQAALEATRGTLKWYVSDLSDADLFVRPAPGANHVAWQIGHVIAGDVFLVKEQLPDAPYPELPAGFTDIHGKDGAAKDGPDGFLSRAEYVDLFDKVRSVTIAEVGKLTDADLDRPVTGNMAGFTPTLGRLLLLVADHTTMHAGQFTVLRRKLGKPVLM